MSIVSDLRSSVDSILGIRDSIGAALEPVYLVTRTWSGDEAGAGTCTEVRTQMLPSPRIVSFAQDQRVVPGGGIDSKDILLKQISRNQYPTKALIDGSSNADNVEKLYKVGDSYYRVISVVEKHLTWNVQLRQLSDQTEY